jgi:hypothetical protein
MRKFQAIGKMTGGRAVEYTSIDAATLEKILTDVKAHALEQYVVGFAPPSSGEAKQHTLEVRLSSGASVEGGKRRATY